MSHFSQMRIDIRCANIGDDFSRNSSIFSANKEKKSSCSHVVNCAHVHLWTNQRPFRKRRNCRPTNCRRRVHSLKAGTSPFVILEFVATKQTLQPPAILVFSLQIRQHAAPLSRRVFSIASRPCSYDKLIQGINFVRDFVQKKKKKNTKIARSYEINYHVQVEIRKHLRISTS